MSLVIRNGRVITASTDFIGDVFIADGTIQLVGKSLDVEADREIDATGRYVMPGAIDPHTHVDAPFMGTVTSDDFTSATVAAAFGGTTSLVDFCLQSPGQSMPDALATWHGKLEKAP